MRDLLDDAVKNTRGQGLKDVIDAGGDDCFTGDASEGNKAYSHGVLGHALAIGPVKLGLCGEIQFEDEVLHDRSPVNRIRLRRLCPAESAIQTLRTY